MKYFLIMLTSTIVMLFCSCSAERVTPSQRVDIIPIIQPDYVGVTLPTTIAPINFGVVDLADEYCVELINARGEAIVIRSESQNVIIPDNRWREFCDNSQGTEFTINVSLLKDGEWIGYKEIECRFASEDIDSHIVYRLISPGYVLWNKMGIYQRELRTFDESKIIDNQPDGRPCMNCHTFSNNSPEKMMLHVRMEGGGTIVAREDGSVEKLKTKTGRMYADGVYPSWSRDGKRIAFSTNEIQQVFHMSGIKPIDVMDMKSDIVVYDVNSSEMISDTVIYSDRYLETFPEWSADGRYLYFCRADTVVKRPGYVIDAHYDLCRIAFDESSSTFGEVEILYAASDIGKSVSFPKCSPDGRYLVFTLSEYGNFSIWHSESDLYLMDLNSMETRVLDEINSDNVDSYHSWSLNGSWLLFSSKRVNGLWARPYISHFDVETARFSKPFVVPQETPDYYLSQMYSYNLPQFVNGKVTLSRRFIDVLYDEPTEVKAGKVVSD